jgi:hypothetical protein
MHAGRELLHSAGLQLGHVWRHSDSGAATASSTSATGQNHPKRKQCESHGKVFHGESSFRWNCRAKLKSA